ncbi:hypothetical protein [Pseudomonas fluorescens]|uniref:Uncharacterized protein n=1 Tax=Pseudomonas fluorescens TaxID=294 RepID=A0A423LRI3_PSEFL|nr:hypothetical protein [Pseudomonas fluorescens]RON70895.1 hypothetical protein BK671_05020 [Pseudomonas fluorescens]
MGKSEIQQNRKNPHSPKHNNILKVKTELTKVNTKVQKRLKARIARNLKNTVASAYVFADQCFTCDGDPVGGGRKIPANGKEFRIMLTELVPAISITSKQFKFPVGTHSEMLEKEFEEPVRTERTYTDYTTTPEIRYLRWVSTMAYVYLLTKEKKVTEIQTLWDGTRLYICDNTRTCTKALENSNDAWFQKQDTSANADSPLKNRYERHVGHLKKLAAKNGAAGYNPTNDPELNKLLIPLDRHTIVYIDDGIGGEKHAEIRLVEYWHEKHVNESKSIYVAGIKRPCLACFGRLVEWQNFLGHKGIKLWHKERPGLFWPSASALRDSTDEERERMAAHLVNLHSLYVTHGGTEIDSDSDEDD